MPVPASIVIPVHNAVTTIAVSIESLVRQPFSEWEAIIVDYGSTDETVAVVKNYAENDSRIIVVSQPNKGVSAARNYGISIAKYDWLLFLEAGDWISECYLEKLTEVTDTNTDLIHCGWRRVADNGVPLQEKLSCSLKEPFIQLTQSCPFAIHACLVRKSIVKEVGGFDPSFQTCEDWDLWQRIARTGASFKAVPEVYAYRRVQPKSLSGNAFQFYKDALRILSQACYPDPRLQHLQIAQPLQSLEGLSNRKFYVTSQTAGLLLGSGEDARPLLALMKEDSALDLDPNWIADTIFDSAIISSARPASQWVTLWPDIELLLKKFLSALEAQSGTTYLARRTQLCLERKILQNTSINDAVKIGTTYAVSLEITKSIEDWNPPSKDVERLFGMVKIEGKEIGCIELPVCNGFVAGWVIRDAIAVKFAWQLLGYFFQHTVYKKKGIDDTELENTHNAKGWTVFLQELWDCPAMEGSSFYNPSLNQGEDATTIESDKIAVIEVSDELPQIKTSANELNVLFTVGGVPAGGIPIHVNKGIITPQAIRVAITTVSGFELCRMVVREALLGKPLHDSISLRQRLAQAASIRKPSVVFSDSYCLLNPLKEEAASKSILLGLRSGILGTSISRPALLPTTVAAELVAMAITEDEPVLRYGSPCSEADYMVYTPSFIHLSSTLGSTRRLKHQPKEKTTVYGRQHFETLFSKTPDPWKYTNPYEQTKYEQTISLLPDVPIKNALELACAEGHFTRQLAPLVETLVAADISSVALERAAERCKDYSNVTFKRFDLFKDTFTDKFDLITCSEVLYYIENQKELKKVAHKLSQALTSNGYIIIAHAHQIVDEPNKPGFDWNLPFGAKVISDIFCSVPTLRLRKEIRTPLYRIQLFQQHTSSFLFSLKKRKPIINEMAQPTPVPSEVADTVRWKGGKPYQEVHKPVFTHHLPVLMYHRVAPDGAAQMKRYRVAAEAFEAQLQYLKDSNYYSITLGEWLMAITLRKPLPGKAIAFTFDDGYTDFYEYAWPLLKKYGFNATVFLVSDYVGKYNSWDKDYGEEVSLMGWDMILQLQQEGVVFGAHSATHPPLTALTPTAIAQQMVQSRKVLQDALGVPITAFAYPYGDTDSVVAHLTGACGFTIGLSCQPGLSTFLDNALSLPRIEVKGTEGLQEFVANLTA